MMGKIYALLVGINQYDGGVRGLNGCVNDVKKVSEFLSARTAGSEFELVPPLVLTSGDAANPNETKPTRQAVIEGFRKHLGQAESGDIAFFYYSGHGSQEPAPPEFWRLEPDRLNETIVCCDSRTPGGWDLADKELSVLLSEIAARGAQVVTVFDSCHSGSITKDLDTVARMTPADNRSRPVQSYLGYESIAARPDLTPEEAATACWVDVPRGPHVVLTACRPEEVAQEQNIGGELHGVLSYYLLDALRRTAGGLTYRDLYARLATLVRNRATGQTPTLDAPDPRELDRPFLGGAIAPQLPYFSMTYDPAGGWTLNGGLVHGIPAPHGKDTAVLAYTRDDVDLAAGVRQDNVLGLARITAVQAGTSQVKLEPKDGKEPSHQAGFRAFVVSVPLPPMIVRLEGDESGWAAVRDALTRAGATGGGSSLVREAKSDRERKAAQVVLEARPDGYRIRRADEAYPLASPLDGGFTPAAASEAVEHLERVARWMQLNELDNKTSALPVDAVRMEFYAVNPDKSLGARLDVPNGGLRFEYRNVNGAWVKPRFKVKLVNTTQRRLYAALLDMTEDFGINSGLLSEGGQWLEPAGQTGCEVWAFGGDPIRAAIPQRARDKNVTVFRDVMKLIVSTTAAPGTLLEQEALGLASRGGELPSGPPQSSLERLFRRVTTRDFEKDEPEADEELSDWTTAQVVITTVQPLDGVAVPREGEAVQLLPTITVQGHPSLNATVRLTTLSEGTRDLGRLSLPRVLTDNPQIVRPFELTSSRGGEPGASVLELETTDTSYQQVTPAAPLVIETTAPLGADETVLAVGYDAALNLFLPLGWARTDGETAVITIDRLPEPVGARDMKSTIRLFLQTIVADKLGIGEADRSRLAVATVAAGQPVAYEADPAVVAARVAASRRILLYVHGLTGDTRRMAASAAGLPPDMRVSNPPPALLDRYDLILTFDYETVRTRVEVSARQLKERLKAVGLGPDHGKTLHIVSHSLGTLVTRWFIEREDGNKVVQKAVLVAPPNRGTPWAKVEDYAIMALAAGINGVASLIWPPAAIPALVGVLASGVKLAESVDITLDEIKLNSPFYQDLDASNDPCVPYGVLVGDTKLIPTTTEQDAALLEILAQKLTSTKTREFLASAVFFGKPNDTAVGVESMRHLPQDREPKPVFLDVACDHVSYFTTADGLARLAELLPA